MSQATKNKQVSPWRFKDSQDIAMLTKDRDVGVLTPFGEPQTRSLRKRTYSMMT